VEGKIAVGTIILERVDHRDWDGKTINEVCLKAQQFSCWDPTDPNRPQLEKIIKNWTHEMANNAALSSCYGIAEGLITGRIPRTKEIKEAHATQYCRVDCHPYWEKKYRKVLTVEDHNFFA
jgi:hypothetical protein